MVAAVISCVSPVMFRKGKKVHNQVIEFKKISKKSDIKELKQRHF